MRYRVLGIVAVLFLCLLAPIEAQQPAPAAGAKDHVEAIKQALQTSMVTLRQYQWVETTVVSIKGEEKSKKVSNCYYGADGKLEKTPVETSAPEKKTPRGIRGRIVENKKEEISDSMKEAIALVKQYVPPDAARIQAAKQAGKLSIVPPDAQGGIQIVIKDYLKPGDALTIAANAATDRITGLTVSTFTDKAKDAVGLKVGFGALLDGTIYPETVNLDVKAQDLGVAITNSGYKKLGN